MKRFLLPFAVTLLLAAAGWRLHRDRADLRLALTAFDPAAPAPERWKGPPARAVERLGRPWDAARLAADRRACLPALAYLARAGETAAFARIVQALDDPDLRLDALLAAGYTGLPGSRSAAIAGTDWDALCARLRAALDDPAARTRLSALFAYHVLVEVDVEDVRNERGLLPAESVEIAEALAAALAGGAVFPGLEEAWPLFLARSFHVLTVQEPAAEVFARSFRTTLAERRSRSEHVLEAMFEHVERLPDPHAEAMIAAALEEPALAAAALERVRSRPSAAFAPGLLRLLARPGTVRREDVVAALVDLVRREDDGSVGDALAGLLRDHDLADGLPSVLHAIHEIRGPAALDRHCPPDLAALPAGIAAPIAELLGRSGYAPFADRLTAAVREAPDPDLRVTALAALRQLARLHPGVADSLAALLCELADAETAPAVPSPDLLNAFLELERADLAPWIARLVARERDTLRQAELLHLRRPARLRRSLQEALAPILAEYAVRAGSRRVRDTARATLERFEFPPEAAPLAARLATASPRDRAAAEADLLAAGSLAPADAAARLGALLLAPEYAPLVGHLLRALAKLPACPPTRARVDDWLGSGDPYLAWRAAVVLLRHDRHADSSRTWEAIRSYLTSPLPGETYPGLVRETLVLLRKNGQTVSQVPEHLARLLRQGSDEEVADAADALLLIGSPAALDVARQVVQDRVPARCWAQAARVLGELGDAGDLEGLARAAGRLAARYGPEDLALAHDAFLGAAETMARPDDARILVHALTAPLPAATTTRLFRLLEVLTGDRYEGDQPEVRKGWLDSAWAR